MSTTPKLSLLLCSLTSREQYLNKILYHLRWQQNQLTNPNDVEILHITDNGEMSIGEKRNRLKALAKGHAFAYIDDDDEVTPTYVELGLKFADSGADCANLKGLFYDNGVFVKPFLHDNKFSEWINDDPNYYIRTPNHLNFWRRELVIGEDFDHVNFGEDGEWSIRIKNKGLVKNQFDIPQILYHYYFRSK